MAQNQWAYLNGVLNTTKETGGEYNHIDSFSVNNRPPIKEHCASGILGNKIWTFGGEGYGKSDIWCYDIKKKAWAFVSDRGSTENHTSLGIESPTAHPGNRSRTASAMGPDSCLWIFGGETYDLGFHTAWNDFWKFNPKTKNWTWLGGKSFHSDAGSYGSTTVPDWPRARYRERGWFDEDGNFWIFGGLYYNGYSPPKPLNDLWKYDLKLSKWTCESGDCNQLFQPANSNGGVYPDSIGKSSVNYKPIPRGDYGYWNDFDGNFWIYGGVNGDVHSIGDALGDTWKYNPKTHKWTLMGLETNKSLNSPGKNSEPLSWLGNDGTPYMRLFYNDIWQFKNKKWNNIKLGTESAEPANIYNGLKYFYHNINRPGSQHSTFCNIKNDSSVFLFNGYGMNTQGIFNLTGSLWSFSLPVFPKPKLKTEIILDDFDKSGMSPYTFSNRQIRITNVGEDTAKNVIVTIGLNKLTSFSAIKLSEISVLDSNNVPIPYTLINIVKYKHPDLNNLDACLFDSIQYATAINISISNILKKQKIIIKQKVEHCMANFSFPVNYLYAWNEWGVTASYKDIYGQKSKTDIIFNDSTKVLRPFLWSILSANIKNDTVNDNPNSYFLIVNTFNKNPYYNTNNLGSGFLSAQVRVDLLLPSGIVLENGSLDNLVGKFTNLGPSVTPLNYSLGLTQLTGKQIYRFYFPLSNFLPMKQLTFKIRTLGANGLNINDIKFIINLTYNKNFASENYGWRTGFIY